MITDIPQSFIDELKKYAEMSNDSVSDDNFMVDDYAAGNIDDAYQIGKDHSLQETAEWVLYVLEEGKIESN